MALLSRYHQQNAAEQGTPLAEETARAKFKRGRESPDEESFPEQLAYEKSQALFNAAYCARRAGKTRGAVRRHRRVLCNSAPGSWTHFGSLIRRNARKHFWGPLKKELDRLGWEYKANEVDMILEVLATGTFCQAFGCDDEAGTKAVQGDSSVLFTIDECHLPNDNVLKLLVEVATPMLTDRGGMLDLIGLPPQVDETYFAKAIDGGGYAVFNWNMFAHDFPRPREEKLATVIQICEANGYKLELKPASNDNGGRPVIDCDPRGTDPAIAWAYFGKRAKDPSMLAYEYKRERNDYDPSTVDFTKGKWLTGWGIDLGFQDADAIVVGSMRLDDPKRHVYERWHWSRNHLDVFVLADVVRCVRAVLQPTQVSGDHGGHGATAILETLGTVLELNIERKPQDVMVSVGLMNDDFRGARFFLSTEDTFTARIIGVARRLFGAEPERLERVEAALTDAEADLRSEFGKVVRSVNTRTKKIEINKQGFHSDLTEAARMMHSCLVRAPMRPAAHDPFRPLDPAEAAQYDMAAKQKAELDRERKEGEQRAKRAARGGMDLMRGRMGLLRR